MLGPKTKMGSITWTLLQTQNLRASLVVHALSAEDPGLIPGQGTRLHAPSAEDPGSIPGQGTRLHVQQLRPSAAIN